MSAPRAPRRTVYFSLCRPGRDHGVGPLITGSEWDLLARAPGCRSENLMGQTLEIFARPSHFDLYTHIDLQVAP